MVNSYAKAQKTVIFTVIPFFSYLDIKKLYGHFKYWQTLKHYVSTYITTDCEPISIKKHITAYWLCVIPIMLLQGKN